VRHGDWSIKGQSVYVTPVSNGQNENKQLLVHNGVEQPIRADANSKHVIRADNPPMLSGERVEPKVFARSDEPHTIGVVNSAQCLECLRLPRDVVVLSQA
jgi:hypothetical protein